MALNFYKYTPSSELYGEIAPPAPIQKDEPGLLGNMGRAAGSGALSATGGIFDFVGAEGVAKQFYGWSDDARQSMSTEAQQDMAKPFFDENEAGELQLGEGLADIDTWLLTLANVAGQFAPTAIPGAGIAGAATKALSLGSTGAKVATAAGMGLTGGSAATGQGMEQARQEYLQMPDEIKAQSELFRSTMKQINTERPGMDADSLWNATDEAIASKLADDVRKDPATLLANFAGSAIADPIIGKALTGARLAKSGAFRSAAKGFAIEGSTEAGQAGVQEYGVNKALAQVDGRDPTDGVALAALNEGVAGGAFGASAGLLGGFANRKQEEPVTDPDADAIRGSNPDLAGAFDSTAQSSAQRQADMEAIGNLLAVSSRPLEGELLPPGMPSTFADNQQPQRQQRPFTPYAGQIEDKNIIFGTDDRSYDDRAMQGEYMGPEGQPAFQPAGLLGLAAIDTQSEQYKQAQADLAAMRNAPQRITDKNVIFAGDGRPQQAAQEFTQNLQRSAEQSAAVPRLPQKDIIFAGDQSGVTVKGNGTPFQSPKEALASKSARVAKKAGQTVEAVKFGDGWGWQPSKAPAADLAGEQIDKEWTAFADNTGTLKIPRAEMPQIKAEHRGAMVQFMKGRDITHEQDTVQADTLKPTQTEFSPAKVKKAMDYDGGNRSILISSDGYVLDGHHQWLAARENGGSVDVIRLNAPIKQLLPLALEFPSSTTADGAQDGSNSKGAEARQAIQGRPTGKASIATTPAGRDIDVEYQVVEADSLVTSNLEDGRSNPDFPSELQPRDRSRAASMDQINRIAGAVNPRLLSESPTTSDGAPIISADGIVESGNGRSLGLRKAYRNGGAEGYRQYLTESGFDVEGMKQPVLVRVRRTELSPEDRLAYIKESNQRTTLEMSATEQAASDSAKMADVVTDYMGGEVTSADNRSFVRKFMQNVAGEAERGGLMDSNGILSQNGRRRIEAALLSAAYGDDGIVAEVFESGDTDIKAIGGALLDAAGKWAQMRNAERDGMIAGGMDVTPFLLEAVNLIRRARAEGKALIELVSTDDIFSGSLPDATRAWLSIFYRGDTLSRARGRDKVAADIMSYADEALKTQPGDGLFGDVVTSDQIMGVVSERNKNQEGSGAQQGGLFTAGNADTTERGAQSSREGQGSGTERTDGPNREQANQPAVAAEPTSQAPADAGVSVSGSPITSGVSAYDGMFEQLRNGTELSATEIRQVIDYLADNQESVLAELNKLTKDDLKNRIGGHMWSDAKKAEYVSRAFSEMFTQFKFIGIKESFVSSSSYKLQDKIDEAKAHVYRLTDEQIAQYSQRLKSDRDARVAEREDRLRKIENPETLDDYRSRIRAQGIASLTPQQKATYDKMVAAETISARNEKPAEKEGLKTDGRVELGDPVEATHGKTGEKIFNVNVITRLGGDAFKEAANFARSMGGGYYKGNFYFKSPEDAELFGGWVNGETVDTSANQEAKAEQRRSKNADRLKQMAERTEQRANESLNADRKVNTLKRLAESERANSKAESENRIAALMRKIPDSDTIVLKGATQKVQVELLDTLARGLVYNAPESQLNRDGNSNLSFKPEVTIEQQVQHARLPLKMINVNRLRDLANEMVKTKGFVIFGRKILSMTKDKEAGSQVVLGDSILPKIIEYIEQHSGQYDMLRDAAARYKRLERMGISNAATLRTALLEFKALEQESTQRTERSRLNTLERELQRTVLGNRNAFNDFFPTPAEMAGEIVGMADIEQGMRVLEPSAGNGLLADAARDLGADVDVVEMGGKLREILTEKGYNLVGDDFLSYQPVQGYDRIVMNPPFSNDQDIKHVLHAYSMLNPGGKLVAITSSMAGEKSNSINKEFKQWLGDLSADEQALPENAFMSSMNSTGVRTKVIVIEKPSDAPAVKFSKTSKTKSDDVRSWANSLKERLGLESLSLTLQESTGTLTLNMIKVADKKQGLGTQAMQEITRYADDLGFKIALTPSLPSDNIGASSRDRLVSFYKRFGFVENKGRNKDYAVSEGMYREPRSGSVKFATANTIKTKPARGVPLEMAKREADKFIKNLSGAAGIKVVVLETQAEAEALWQMSLDGDMVRGAYDDKTGTAYVIAENVRNISELKQVVAHEVMAHGGLAKVIGKQKKADFLNKLKATRNNKYFVGLWKQIDRDYDGMSEDAKAEELFAYYVQNKPITGPIKFWWNALKRWLNNVLADFGITRNGDPDIDLMDDMMESIMFGFQFGREAKSAANDKGVRFSKTSTATADQDNRTAKEKLGLEDEARETLAQQAKRRTKETIDTLKQQSFWQRLNEGIFDGMAGIKQAEESVGVTDPNKQGYVSARLASGLADVLHGVFNYGAPEWRDGVVARKADTKGMLEVFGMLGDDLNNWLAWMGANRAEQLMAEGRENNLTAKDIAELKALADGKEALFEEVRKEYNKINSAVIDLAEQAGLLSKEQRSGFDEEWYVPFFRNMENEVDPEMSGIAAMVHGPRSRSGIAGQSAQIKELKGGKQSTKDLLENIIHRQSTMIDAALKNKAMLEIVENLDGTDYMEAVTSPDIAALSQTELNLLSKVKVMRNGKAEAYAVSDPALLRGLLQINDAGSKSLFNRMARGAKRFVTAGITLSPDFIFKNFVRDAAHAWMINKDDFKFGADSIKGLKKAFKEDELYRDLIFSGAAFQGGYVHGGDPEAASQQIRRTLAAKGLGAGQIDSYMDSLVTKSSQLFEKYRNASDKVENANRLSTYEAALAKGKSKREAAFFAKDLMDYSLKGNFAMIGTMIDMLPFFNARLQGMSKLVRAARAGDGDRVLKVLSANLMMKGMKVAAFSLALAAMNDDDERYQELPDWDKDGNWHFWIGDNHFRIPKPFELGIVFGTIPERMFNYGTGNQSGSDLGKSVAHAVFNTLALNPIPQIALPMVEVMTNKSFFKGSAIEGMADENKQAQDRYNAYTSDVAKLIGEAFGVSPKKVEHLVVGYTGTIGGYVLGMSDMMARQMLGIEKADTPISRYPVIKAFYQGDTPKTATKFQDEFYDAMETANQAWGSYKRAVDEGDVVRQQELKQSESKALGARVQLSRVQRQLSELSKRAEMVNNDKQLTSAQKRQRLDEITVRKNELFSSAYVRHSLGEW
jgi:hypothetical protein